jgi:hypothetical protein
MPLFPPKFKALLRYADSFLLVSTSGAVASYVFSCNGLYDPNITGTGHQPAGFDQMMLSYEHYTVTRARIVGNFANFTGAQPQNASISHRAGSTPITVVQQLYEDGLIKTDRMMGGGIAGALCTISLSANIAQFGGVPNLRDNPDYKGTIAANPVEQQYFHVQAWSVDVVTTNCNIDIVMEFEAIFTEPRTLSQSLAANLTRSLRLESKNSGK